MTNQKYKNLTLREFDAAAEKFDDSDPSVYNLCRKDYPDLLEELLNCLLYTSPSPRDTR